MNYDPQKHHRRSIRLKGYDYTSPGAYFITVCVEDRKCMFGDVVNGEMELNAYGEIVQEEWYRTAEVRSNVELDAFVVMPNHIHGIIIIVDNVGATRRVAPDAATGVAPDAETGAAPDAATGVAPDAATGVAPDAGNVAGLETGATRRVAPTDASTDDRADLPRGPKSGSIGAIMAQFKSIVTKRINRVRATPGAPVWQRNYYEHIVRTDGALKRIRKYIADNPAKWELDQLHPDAPPNRFNQRR